MGTTSNLQRWFVQESHDPNYHREHFSSLATAEKRAKEISSESDGDYDVVDTLGRHAAIVVSSWTNSRETQNAAQ